MRNYCTLFDSNFLSRGMVMYESLKSVSTDFHLYIFAFDSVCYDYLIGEKLEFVTVISLKEFEDEKLLEIKSTRSVAEYCWTCTPSTILYCIEHYSLDNCTYIDADLYFYSSPEPFFAEMGKRSILLTEHRYSEQYALDEKNGKFCVQFVTIKNDERGMMALKWWRERCLEWCFDRHEEGKFGDQGYLNDWEMKFDGVHSLNHLGGGVAAWNVQQYTIINEDGKLFCTDNATRRDFELVFYHFHYLRLLSGGMVEFGRRDLSNNVISLIYKPYLIALEDMKKRIQKKLSGIDPHGLIQQKVNWKTPILFIYRKLKGVYHIYKLEDILSR